MSLKRKIINREELLFIHKKFEQFSSVVARSRERAENYKYSNNSASQYHLIYLTLDTQELYLKITIFVSHSDPVIYRPVFLKLWVGRESILGRSREVFQIIKILRNL